jgi:hypothetical protein
MGDGLLRVISGLYGVIGVHSKEARDGSVIKRRRRPFQSGVPFDIQTMIQISQ